MPVTVNRHIQHVNPHPDCDKAYAELSTQEIMQQVEHQHAQIIALYKHLRGHVETPTAQDFMDQLISLEQALCNERQTTKKE
jgi:hypothetical protein